MTAVQLALPRGRGRRVLDRDGLGCRERPRWSMKECVSSAAAMSRDDPKPLEPELEPPSVSPPLLGGAPPGPYVQELGSPLPDDAEEWGRLIEEAGPASLLVAIEGRMGAALRRSATAEDVLQEALLAAWRSRASTRWQGPRAFRAWLLTIATNRLRDLVDANGAEKRGGGSATPTFSELAAADAPSSLELGPVASTTPSRALQVRERADVMRAALESLPDALREVVRLRLFEERSVAEVAAALGIGVSAVKHRFLAGAAEYRRRLQAELWSRSGDRDNSRRA